MLAQTTESSTVFAVGMAAATAAYEKRLRSYQEGTAHTRALQAARQRGLNYQDPGRSPANCQLLARSIPVHVDAILDESRWEQTCDRQEVFRGVVEVAHSLLLRGIGPEDFIDIMDGYQPRPQKYWYCGDHYETRQRQNHLWHAVTHRGNRDCGYMAYSAMVHKAFDYAQEHLDEGFVARDDQKAYLTALTRAWSREWDHTSWLTQTDRLVLDWVSAEMIRRADLAPTLPCRVVGDGINRHHIPTWRSLRRLADAGILICHTRGHDEYRMAAIYSLSSKPRVVPNPYRTRGRPPRPTNSRPADNRPPGTPAAANDATKSPKKKDRTRSSAKAKAQRLKGIKPLRQRRRQQQQQNQGSFHGSEASIAPGEPVSTPQNTVVGAVFSTDSVSGGITSSTRVNGNSVTHYLHPLPPTTFPRELGGYTINGEGTVLPGRTHDPDPPSPPGPPPLGCE